MKAIIEKLLNHKIILKNTSYLTLIEFFRLLMPFIALPYIIKTVGSYNYGMIVFAQTIISYFIVFINFGLDISAVKDVAISRDNKCKLDKIVSSVLTLKLIFVLLSASVLLLGILIIPELKKHYLLYSFAFLTCFSEVLFPIWFYQGIEKMQYLAIIRFLAILLYTASIFIFIREMTDYIYIPLLQSLGNVIAGLVSFYLLIYREKINLKIPTLALLKKTFKDSVPFFTSRLSVVINNSIAKTVSGLLFSMNAVAAFDLAQKITSVAIVPIQMLNQAIYPHIAKTKDRLFAQKYLYFNILLSIFIAILVYLLSPLAINFFSNNELPEAIIIVRILCIWVFLAGIVVYIGAPVLVSFGYPKPFNRSVILSSILLILCYLVIYFLDMANIYLFALILVMAESVMLFYRFYYCLKYKIFVFPWNKKN